HHRSLPSFPTRRSSDLFGAKGSLSHPTIEGYSTSTLGQTATGVLFYRAARASVHKAKIDGVQTGIFTVGRSFVVRNELTNIGSEDRKSTRLNSSHVSIS